jgi:hypothetical protein
MGYLASLILAFQRILGRIPTSSILFLASRIFYSTDEFEDISLKLTVVRSLKLYVLSSDSKYATTLATVTTRKSPKSGPAS